MIRWFTAGVYLFGLTLLLPATSASGAFVFSDDFNDGDLVGWEAKQGDWSNTGNLLLSSWDNYGVMYAADSFGLDQIVEVDARLSGSPSKSAHLRLRNGTAPYGGNRYFDHGYFAGVSETIAWIYNAVNPGDQRFLGSVDVSLTQDWHRVKFSVTGQGDRTRLQLWVDGDPLLDVFDTTGVQHDDGGYVGLGSSNHLNRRIEYDNFSTVPEPTTMGLLAAGALAMLRRRR